MLETLVSIFEDRAIEKKIAQGHSVLLTYNGPWGLRDEADEKWITLDNESMETVIERLQACRIISSLWNAAQIFAKKLSDLMKASDHAVSLELSTGTFHEEHHARVHLHIYLRSNNRMYIRMNKFLKFKGMFPVPGTIVAGLPASSRGNLWSGAFSFETRPTRDTSCFINLFL